MFVFVVVLEVKKMKSTFVDKVALIGAIVFKDVELNGCL